MLDHAKVVVYQRDIEFLATAVQELNDIPRENSMLVDRRTSIWK